MSSPFERMFRQAFYADFGTTPERMANDFLATVRSYHPKTAVCDWLVRQPKPDRYKTSHFELTLEEMLDQFEGNIRDAARLHNIDGRAIAGAIAWEYEQNWCLGRASDYAPDLIQGPNDGRGWGSIHLEEAKTLYPNATRPQLDSLRYEAASAIEMVAAIMDKRATQYFNATRDPLVGAMVPTLSDLREPSHVLEKSGGVWIRDSPPILAVFFNTSVDFLQKSIGLQNSGQRASTWISPYGSRVRGVTRLVVGQNRMGRWVLENLARFDRFRTQPVWPPTQFTLAEAALSLAN